MTSSKKLFLILAVAFFGTFLVTKISNAADCPDKNRCCKCYSGTIGEDVVTYSTKFLAQTDSPSASNCNIACYKAWPEATYYIYGDNLSFKDINRNPVSQQNTGAGTSPTISATDKLPGTTEAGGLVQCGRAGQRMCTLCDLILGINVIIKYGFRIAIVIALTMLTVGGVMYMVGNVDQAKELMKNTVKGIIFVFAAWLLVNYSMILLGTKTDLGITQTKGSWFTFTCK